MMGGLERMEVTLHQRLTRWCQHDEFPDNLKKMVGWLLCLGRLCETEPKLWNEALQAAAERYREDFHHQFPLVKSEVPV